MTTHTVSVSLVVTPDSLVGHMQTTDPFGTGGSKFVQPIEISATDHPFETDPASIAAVITPGVRDFFGFASVFQSQMPPMHGWSMPYRSADGNTLVLEFDFDNERN